MAGLAWPDWSTKGRRDEDPDVCNAARAQHMVPVVYIACALVWGTTWFAIRRCIGPGGYPVVAGAALRFALATAILAVAWRLGWARPGPRGARQLKPLLWSGLLGAVSYALVYLAERSISGGLAAIVFGTFPLVTALVATVTGVERVKPRALVGAAIALAGIAIVFADRVEVSAAQGVGIVLMLGAVLASAVYSTVIKQVGEDVHPLATTGVFIGVTAAVLGVGAAVVEREAPPWPPPLGPTVALLYLAVVGSVLVFAGYFYLLKRVSLMTMSMIVVIEPLVAVAVDAVWEHEVVLGPRSYAGMVVTLGGVAASVLVRSPRKA
jgi:drug/metabolite transporter (DMT)-like permease